MTLLHSGLRRTLHLLLAALVLHLVLIQPNHPDAMSWGALSVFPLELPAILLALIALGQTRMSGPLRAVLTLVLCLIVLLKTADFISFSALSRGFNPVADLALVDAFLRLLTGTFGWPAALAAVLGAVASLLLLAALIWWATGVWARVNARPVVAGLSGVAAALSTVIAAAEIGQTMGRWTLPFDPPGTAFTARVGVERIEMAQNTLSELRSFRAEAARDPFVDAPGLFGAIDRDVLVIFIESYGRTSFDTPFYAGLHRQTLAGYESRLARLGLAMRSGYLTSPTRGGQSWLAHATFANGLWINNQIGYGAALSSGRESLFHHAANSGFRTATVMPQITLDWPEADRMGFETVLVAADLGYRGLPFNWVTMPDQFTLAALDRLLRSGDDTRRLFAQVALVSSHAPWVPVPDIVPWEDIGDGTIFNAVAASGDPPEVVWRDRERVRAQYRLAVDYSLRAVLEYALRHAAEPPLMIIVGDHQAAEFIALDGRPDVPIHVIGPEPLVARLTEAAPYPGLRPADDATAIPMDRMRDILLNAYFVQSDTGAVN
ncbi:sulfatase [Rhodophyticola porphyridii]|uniref:Sulfatase n=2 Tax=Rhodophyticola porphyridii TaxID=1852017 RepID=A0A3L9Y228_9RHOB|nr:sulfatase [Rhodophyticola porphyridii]